MNVSRIDLINRTIPKAFRGYDCDEVDRLMQDMSDALAKATDERVTLTSRAKELEKTLGEYKEREKTLQEALITTRSIGTDLRAAAQKEAQLILETARIKAEGLLQNANIRLARLMEEIAGAEKNKARLEMKLRNTIEEHLHLLDMEKEAGERMEKALQKNLAGLDGPEKGA